MSETNGSMDGISPEMAFLQRLGLDNIPAATVPKASRSFRHPEFGIAQDKAEREELLKIASSEVETRESLMRTLVGLQKNDVVQTVIDVVIDDAFASGPEDRTFFEVTYEPRRSGKKGREGKARTDKTTSKYQQKIDEFVARFRLNALIKNILEDLLTLGEYPLRVQVDEEKKERGILEIRDDVDPITLIGVYDLDEPRLFLEKQGQNRFVVRHPHEIIHFVLDSRKVRVKTTDDKQRRRKMPEYVRAGRSVFYNALSKIKQLQILEWAVTALDLKKLIAPILVTVNVPAQTAPQDAKEIAREYERFLGDPFKLYQLQGQDGLTFQDLLGMVGRFQVLPAFGDGKGTIDTLQFNNDAIETDDRKQRLRVEIAMAIGIPPYYLAPQSESGQSKLETLKIYSRYSRMLMDYQESLASAIRRLIGLHMRYSGTPIDEQSLKVRFRSLINIELLDFIEFAVASIQTLNDMATTFDAIAASLNLKVHIDNNKFVEMANRFLSSLEGATGLLRPVSEHEFMQKQAAQIALEQGVLPGEGGSAYGELPGAPRVPAPPARPAKPRVSVRDVRSRPKPAPGS